MTAIGLLFGPDGWWPLLLRGAGVTVALALASVPVGFGAGLILALVPKPLRTLADIRDHTLLHLEWDWRFGAWPDWETWLRTAGVTGVDVSRGIWFTQMSIALEAAIQGQGVALTTRALSADEIAQGHLVAPFATTIETPFGYYFICRPEALRDAKFVALRQWLIDEAARSEV